MTRSRVQLALYVAGTTSVSSRAIVNVRKLCDGYLGDDYDLDVIDLSRHPQAAASAQIVAVPTLIKLAPLPVQRFIGDLSDPQRVLQALGVNSPGLKPLDDDHEP